jgi:hypothetical protein
LLASLLNEIVGDGGRLGSNLFHLLVPVAEANFIDPLLAAIPV